MTPRKTATEIAALIIAQLETSLGTTIPLLPKAFLRVLAKVFGGVFVLLYQYVGFAILQLFVKTASNKPMVAGGLTIVPLQLWGDLVGITQGAGQRAEYTVEITVLVQGGTLTSGERLINPTTEMIYVLVGDVALDAATKTATVRATQVGELGNVDVGEFISFVSPPAAVEKEVEITVELAVGADAEDTEDFRQRILDYFAARPQGGAYADYRDWAQEVAGVKRAYPYSGWQLENHPEDGPTQGSGEVFVFIESLADPDGVPDPLGNPGRPDYMSDGALLLSVFEYIEADDAGLANRRNINAYVRVYPITRTAFNVEIQGLETETETETKAAIIAGLTDYFLEREPFINGLSLPPRNDIISQMQVGTTAAVIASGVGGGIARAIVRVSTTAYEHYYLQEGEKAKLGVVTWT